MKTLKSDALGGMPLDGDDFTWMTTGYLEAFKAILDGFIAPGDSNGYIITGCIASISGANVVISPGVIYSNNRIRPYAGQTVLPANFKTPELSTDFNYDPTGTETFEDGFVRETYLNEYATGMAQIGGLISQAAYVLAVNNLPRIKRGWTLNSVIEDWIKLPITAPFVTYVIEFGATALQCRRLIGNRVELAGSFSHPVGATGILATLPVGYRPDKRIHLPLIISGGSGTTRQQTLRIDTDGSMRLGDGHTLSSIGYYSVEGLSFPLTRDLA